MKALLENKKLKDQDLLTFLFRYSDLMNEKGIKTVLITDQRNQADSIFEKNNKYEFEFYNRLQKHFHVIMAGTSLTEETSSWSNRTNWKNMKLVPINSKAEDKLICGSTLSLLPEKKVR